MTDILLNIEGKRKAIFLVFCMVLALAPLSHVSAEDLGVPANLQAQDIVAVFDPVSETTLVTWRNIDIDSSILQGLFSATYNVYRSNEIITSTNISSLTPFETGIVACSSIDVVNDAFQCRGFNGTVDPHSASFLVEPGENDSFYYAVTTTLGNGTELFDLDIGASVISTPILEQTTPIRTPYNIVGSYDPETSETTLQWVNYNDINPILPETGADAYQIHLYRTSYPVTRANGANMMAVETPVAVLPAGTSSLIITIPENTDRDAYYSVTYLLPNLIAPGVDYMDIRFLSNNAMATQIFEDNMPPGDAVLIGAEFLEEPISGGGTTTVTWVDVAGESGESYRIYMSGIAFNSILRSDVQFLATISEGVESFSYEVPTGRLGFAYYCIVTVDFYEVYDTNVSSSSCSDAVDEDAWTPWIAEPGDVHAEFIGNQTTRVTWTDQLGVEGERYHIWSAGYRVSGAEWMSEGGAHYLTWLGSVSDGIGYFDVALPEGLNARQPFYFVTTEALYGHISGTYMDKRLNQNADQLDDDNREDTISPAPARMKIVESIGYLNKVTIEWINAPLEVDETYQVWRHYGDPFGEDESEFSSIDEEGWELAIDNIDAGTSPAPTFFRQLDLPEDIDRDVWYAVIITDKWNNSNPETYSGSGSNTMKVTEDTKVPQASLLLINEDNEAFTSPSLIAGDYKVQIEFDEYLDINPTINITTVNGGDISSGNREMVLIQENTGNPDRGPVYQLDFFITTSTIAGDMVFEVEMEDLANNQATQIWTDRAVDAVPPEVTIYSPSSNSDGSSKYLYGNLIQVLAGAQDDVRIDSFQYKFTYNYGTSQSVSTPWTEATSVTNLNGDNSSIVLDLDFSAGNFLPGQHAVFVRAIDSAGNERSDSVIFTVDDCRNRLDGTTSCNYVESLKPEPEPITINPSMTDPPYILVWILSGIFVFSLIVMLMVIRTSMSGPKKKKKGDDDDDEDEDWMSEFIGTNQELDMNEVTDTSDKSEEKSVEPEEKIEVEEEEDPFAVNTVSRKTRRKKDAPEEVVAEEDDDDDGIDWGEYDDQDDEEEEEKPVAKKRAVGRRAAPRKAPKRRAVGRKKSDD